MNKNVVVYSIFVSVILLAILTWSIFGIFFKYWGDISAIKDSLSAVSGIFGGLATLGAAVIAAHLFNDWRDQHNKSVSNEYAKKVLESYDKLSNSILEFELKKDELNSDLFYFLIGLQLFTETDSTGYLKKVNDIKSIATIIKTNFNFFKRNLKHYNLLVNEEKTSIINIKKFENIFKNIKDVNDLTLNEAKDYENFFIYCDKACEDYLILQESIEIYELDSILKSLKV